LLQAFGVQEFVLQNKLLCALKRILGERLAPYVVGHVARVIVFTMTREPQSGGDNELRSPAGARSLDGAANNFEALREIGAVHGTTFVTVAFRAIDQISAAKLAVVWGRIGVVVIGRHHDQRDPLDRGDVHPFVGRAGLHAAFADRRQPDKSFLALHSLR
jgi:hypothetical protein